MREVKPIQLYVLADQRTRLNVIAAQKNTTVADIIRKLIEEYLKDK